MSALGTSGAGQFIPLTQSGSVAGGQIMSIRETIMQGLFDRLKISCGTTFAYYSRKFINWADLGQMITTPSPDRDPRQLIRAPALFLYDGFGFGGGRNTWAQGARGQPAKRSMTPTVVIYGWRDSRGDPVLNSAAPSGASNAPGAPYFYPLIDAVEAAFDPEPNLPGFDSQAGSITLNGIATFAWVEGSGEIYPGDIDPIGLGMTTIPLRVVIP